MAVRRRPVVKPLQGLLCAADILTQGALEDSRPWAALWNRFAVKVDSQPLGHDCWIPYRIVTGIIVQPHVMRPSRTATFRL